MKKIILIILVFCTFAFCEFTLESKIDYAIYPINGCEKIKPSKSPWHSILSKNKNNKNATKVAYRCDNLSFYMLQNGNVLSLFLSGITENTNNFFIIRLLTEDDWKTEDGEYKDMGFGVYEEADENDIMIVREETPYNEYEGVKAKIFEIYNTIKSKINQ